MRFNTVLPGCRCSDEGPRRAMPDKIPNLRPAFTKDGTITAANASSISDGASAIVLARAEAAEAELTAKLAKKTKAAETKLSKMRDEALANIHDVAKELTLETVRSVTGIKVKKTEADKAVKKVIKLSGQEA